MDSPSELSWVHVLGFTDSCPIPPLTPDLTGPHGAGQHGGFMMEVDHTIPTSVPGMKLALQNAEAKQELHSVLNAIQSSQGYGIFVCESFKDPRRESIDDYWGEVQAEAVGLQYLHRLIGTGHTPLTDDARRRLHHFSRLLSRLSQRIDRVVLSQPQ